MNKGVIGIGLVILALGALLFGLQHYTPGAGVAPEPPPPPAPKLPQQVLKEAWPVLIQNAASPKPLGNPNAPYTMLEIGDFQCPNCGKAEPMVMHTLESSGGKAKLYFYDFPLPTIHPHAMIAAQAGLSAAAQGKFWQMYQLLYTHQDELIDSQIEFDARSIPGLDTNKLTQDLSTQKYLATLNNELRIITSIPEIQSVPMLLVRDPSGNISVFEGAAPTVRTTYPGIIVFAQNPSWTSDAAKAAIAATQPKSS